MPTVRRVHTLLAGCLALLPILAASFVVAGRGPVATGSQSAQVDFRELEEFPAAVAVVPFPEGVPRVSIVREDGALYVPARVERSPEGTVVVVLPLLPEGAYRVHLTLDSGIERITRTVDVAGFLLHGRPFGAFIRFWEIPVESPPETFEAARTGVARFVVFREERGTNATVVLLLMTCAFIAAALSRRRFSAAIPAALAAAALQQGFVAGAVAAAGLSLALLVDRSRLMLLAYTGTTFLSTGILAGWAAATGVVLTALAGRALPLSRRTAAPLMLGLLFMGAAAYGRVSSTPVSDPAGSVRPADCVTEYDVTDPRRVNCLGGALSPAFEASPPRILGVVDDLVAQGHVSDCHSLAHIVGRRIAHMRSPGDVTQRVADRCSYGYVHGMLDEAAMIMTTEDFVDFVSSTCYGAPEPVRSNCGHGAGHALFQRTGGDTFAAADACLRIEPDTSSECLVGAFMSNAEQFLVRDRLRPGSVEWLPVTGGDTQALRPWPNTSESHEVCELVAPVLAGLCVSLTMDTLSENSNAAYAVERAESLILWCAEKFPQLEKCSEGIAASLFPAGTAPHDALLPSYARSVCSRTLFPDSCLQKFVHEYVQPYKGRRDGATEAIRKLCPGLAWEECSSAVSRNLAAPPVS